MARLDIRGGYQMKNVNEYFEKRVNEMISNSNRKVFFVFKGFSRPQMHWLSIHPRSILKDPELFVDDCLNIETINEKWLDILQALKVSDHTLVGFYEELFAIREFLPRVNDSKIVIIENNLLSPWIPCYIKQEYILPFFDFLQEDREPENNTIRLLFLYYSDIKLLENNQALLLPISIDEEYVTTLPFWQAEVIETDITPTQRIELGTSADWMYRLQLLEKKAVPPALFLQSNKPLNISQHGLESALSTLGVAFRIQKREEIVQKVAYNTEPLIPIFKKHWGDSAEFRPLYFYKDPNRSRDLEAISQGEIISEIINQCESAITGKLFQNIFITAPTGAGKSLLFQLPALYMAEQHNSVTIVVSPLIALMNDQVDQLLRKRGITIAACINSTMTIEERIAVIDQIQSGEKSLIYLAPELLLTTHFQTFLGNRRIGLIVIDEAHTVTSWGRDFRSDYWFLGDFLKKAKRDGLVCPVLCLTATAVYSGEDDVVNDTIQELDLDNTIIHLGNVKRENICFDISRHSTERLNTRVETEKINLTLARMRQYISDHEKVLTYFPYRSQVDLFHSQLKPIERIQIRRYHSQIPAQERKMVESAYKTGAAMGLACTKAFGMGVDVGDIKHIIHFAPAGTLADYVQEIGRAARNPDIQGVAHIDYFPGDIRYIKALNGISEMRQYQLKEMLKKLCSIYEAKKRRNLLISAETFEYLFKENEVENRTKSGLMLLAKDLANKYSFPVLIVRPKAMLSKNYVNIPFEMEEQFLQKYSKYVQKAEGETKRSILSNQYGQTTETLVYSTGNTYIVSMADIWEEFFPELSFGMFKKQFFETDTVIKGEKFHPSPRVRVEIRYTDDFDSLLSRVQTIVQGLSHIFSEYKHSEHKQFTLQNFEEKLRDFFGEKIVSHEKTALLLDIFTENVDENAAYTHARSRVRVLRKRKQPNADETCYFISSPAYASLAGFFCRLMEQCRPRQEGNAFCRFYPTTQGRTLEIMPLLRLLELLGFAGYEIRGGEKAEIFIRINDPSKLQRLANSDYKNGVLQSIQSRHRHNQQLIDAFFTKELSSVGTSSKNIFWETTNMCPMF